MDQAIEFSNYCGPPAAICLKHHFIWDVFLNHLRKDNPEFEFMDFGLMPIYGLAQDCYQFSLLRRFSAEVPKKVYCWNDDHGGIYLLNNSLSFFTYRIYNKYNIYKIVKNFLKYSSNCPRIINKETDDYLSCKICCEYRNINYLCYVCGNLICDQCKEQIHICPYCQVFIAGGNKYYDGDIIEICSCSIDHPLQKKDRKKNPLKWDPIKLK